ncbi:helix-turn-helix transcriptional regulator [Streptomyces niveus]|uniref:LuxR C-terminal-related transcriptional regulator n=1 Tax=Streptomyces niveus TaxID=193462 RepID=A0ABZ2A802_STRNV|nr:LuxR C-terminal-related transcriptional regulator [Streptomyces niveus]WTA60754.1 LuxR C-terminal-related transcriptional regulator [Streptomyces niveus]
MENQKHHPHSDRELCDTAIGLYTDALRKGRITRAALTPAPCLVDMALVHPDPLDEAWMCPVPPSAALAHLLQPIAREIHERVRLSASLVDSLAPLSAVVAEDPNLSITTLDGHVLIDAKVGEAARAATREILTVQPGFSRERKLMMAGLSRSLAAIERGARLRHLYQHPARYSPHIKEYLEQVPADRLEVRTVEQTVERLIIVDRTVAFIPASANRHTALEIRHPALITYLVQVYEVLWSQATPMTERPPILSPDAAVTSVQRGIARLLAEGITDESVARRMGISVRTCRAHIAKLMQALNASSRTHLGVLLIQSGLVDARTSAEHP